MRPHLFTALFARRAGRIAAATAVSVAGCAVARQVVSPPVRTTLCEAAPQPISGDAGKIYTRDEVAQHKTAATGIWVTFKDGVYDITEFIAQHPGGDKILLAAGGPTEPYWALYTQHYQPNVQEILKEYRIGSLDPTEAKRVFDMSDPYANDPDRHPALQAVVQKPYNAECPPQLLVESLITPNPLWFVRNHHPVPVIDPEQYKLQVVVGDADQAPMTQFTLEQLKDESRFQKHTVISTLQCAGNRRTEMHEEKPLSGNMWQCGAIGTAVWRGAWLRDVMAAAGVDVGKAEGKRDEYSDLHHVQFKGVDSPFAVSIPVEKALSPNGDVLLAYEMNGETLPRDHGYPVRAIVPGYAAIRNAKWLDSVRLSKEEAHGVWQRGWAYKGLSSSVDNPSKLNPQQVASVYEMPVTSAIVTPANGSTVLLEDEYVPLKGFAWSGGGRGIVRVEVSTDKGHSWAETELEQIPEQQWDKAFNKAWAWTLWKTNVRIPQATKPGGQVDILCRAVDTSYNSQPESVRPVWNVRGILNNSMHKITVGVEGPPSGA